MTARLLRADDPAWTSVLQDAAHSFHHLPAYVRLAARQEGGEARALLVEGPAGTMLLPLVVRPVGEGAHDAVSPYGYGGPILDRSADPDRLHDALREGIRLLASLGFVSLFVRFHPLLPAAPPDGIGTGVRHGETVAVDLARPPEVLWRETRRDHRLQIGRALRAGHEVVVGAGDEHLATFGRLYRATMARRGAASTYFFDDAYFEELRDALADRLRLVLVIIDEAVAAAAVFVEADGIVEYHLSATDPRFVRSGPTKLMIHVVREWARGRGNRWLHLGGGVGAAADSLFDFKAGFSPVRRPFWTLRVVVDESRYERLVAVHDPGRDPTVGDGFFPLYRKPSPMPADRGGGSLPPDEAATSPRGARSGAAP
jgi:CelD/BcsL family acetyltransferase involved in cellulose biosynthesis